MECLEILWYHCKLEYTSTIFPKVYNIKASFMQYIKRYIFKGVVEEVTCVGFISDYDYEEITYMTLV